MLKFLQPHSQTVQYKELYLPPEMLHSLNPEQQALVDFLVLANSDNFVGLGSSTFSVYLRCVDIGDAWIHKHSMLAFLQRPIGWWVGQGGAVPHGWLQLAPHVAVGKLSVDSTPKLLVGCFTTLQACQFQASSDLHTCFCCAAATATVGSTVCCWAMHGLLTCSWTPAGLVRTHSLSAARILRPWIQRRSAAGTGHRCCNSSGRPAAPAAAQLASSDGWLQRSQPGSADAVLTARHSKHGGAGAAAVGADCAVHCVWPTQFAASCRGCVAGLL